MKLLKIFFAMMLVVLLTGVGVSAQPGMGQQNAIVLQYKTMVGVDGPFLGASNPINGIPGGGRPWVLEDGSGKLEANGRLDIKVRGLIIPASEGPQFGINPAPFFRAVVSCMSVNEFNQPFIINTMTQNGDEVMIGDPRNGDARIREIIDLPDPCLAPIIFVTSPAFSWFAVTGVGVVP